MMMNVCQTAGGGDDMPRGMPGGASDDGSGVCGHGHDASTWQPHRSQEQQTVQGRRVERGKLKQEEE